MDQAGLPLAQPLRLLPPLLLMLSLSLPLSSWSLTAGTSGRACIAGQSTSSSGSPYTPCDTSSGRSERSTAHPQQARNNTTQRRGHAVAGAPGRSAVTRTASAGADPCAARHARVAVSACAWGGSAAAWRLHQPPPRSARSGRMRAQPPRTQQGRNKGAAAACIERAHIRTCGPRRPRRRLPPTCPHSAVGATRGVQRQLHGLRPCAGRGRAARRAGQLRGRHTPRQTRLEPIVGARASARWAPRPPRLQDAVPRIRRPSIATRGAGARYWLSNTCEIAFHTAWIVLSGLFLFFQNNTISEWP